jgi:hypothetical protein
MVGLEEAAAEAVCIRAEGPEEAEAEEEDRPTGQASYSEVPPSPKMYKRSRMSAYAPHPSQPPHETKWEDSMSVRVLCVL